MATAIKLADLIKTYNGEGDFLPWIKKLELVAKLQKINDLTSFVPLFLEGGAFAVYDGLDTTVKTDYKRLVSSLTEAFSINKFAAYEELMKRRLRRGESIDVFLADLKRLATLIDEFVPESLIQCALVYGLPEEMKLQLKAACKVENMSLSETIQRCRMLINADYQWEVGAVAEANVRVQRPREKRCFKCGSDSHLMRQYWLCPENKKKVQKQEDNKEGHESKNE